MSELYEPKCLAKLDWLGALGYCRRKLESGNVIPMSPSEDWKFLSLCFLNRKQLFFKGLFCVCLMYSIELKWKQTFRLSCNNFTGKFHKFPFRLGKRPKVSKPRTFHKIKPLFFIQLSCLSCSDFYLGYCGTLQWETHGKISRAFSQVWSVWSSPCEHLCIHLLMLKSGNAD